MFQTLSDNICFISFDKSCPTTSFIQSDKTLVMSLSCLILLMVLVVNVQAFAGGALIESLSAPPHGVFCCRRMQNAVAEMAAAFFTDYFAFIEPCSVKLFEIIIAHTFRAFCVLLLNVIKHKTADNSFMVAFNVILRQLSPICTLLFREIIDVAIAYPLCK